MAITFDIGFRLQGKPLNEVIAPSILALSKEIDQAFQNSSARGGNLSKPIKEAISSANALGAALKTATTDKGLSFSLMERSLARSNTSVAEMVARLGSGGPAFQQSFNLALNSIATANRQVVTLSSKLQEAGRVFTQSLKFTTAQTAIRFITGQIQSSIGWVKDLDSTLAQIATVSGKTGTELEKTYNNIIQGAADLRVAAGEYAEASLIFYQQGLNDSEVAHRTEVTIQAAKAAGQSVSTMASQLTAIWNSYRMVGEEQERAAAVGAKLAASTAVDFKDIAEAMQIAAAGASQMGVSYDSLAAIIATVGDATQQSASIIGNAYKTIFSRFEQLTVEGSDGEVTLNSVSSKLQALGVNIMDTSGKLKSLDDVIYQVGIGWENYSEEQQLAIAQLAGGTRQYGQFLSLMQNFPEYLTNLKTATEETGSTLIDQFLAARDTIEAAAENSREAWSRAFKDLFKADSMKDLYKASEDIANAVKKIIDGFGGWQGIIVQIGVLFQKNISDKIQDAMISSKNFFKNLTPEMSKENIKSENVKETQTLNDQIKQNGTDLNNAEAARAKLKAAQEMKLVMVDVNRLISSGNAEMRQEGENLLITLNNAQNRLNGCVDTITEMQSGYTALTQEAERNLSIIEAERDVTAFLDEDRRAELAALQEKQVILQQQESAAQLEVEMATIEANIGLAQIQTEATKLDLKLQQLEAERAIQEERKRNASANGNTAEAEDARNQLKILDNQIESAKNLAKSYQKSQQEINSALANITKAHKNLKTEVDLTTKAIQKFTNAGAEGKDIAKQTQQVSKAFTKMADDMGNAMKSNDKSSMGAIIQQMKSDIESSDLPPLLAQSLNEAFDIGDITSETTFSAMIQKFTQQITAFNADPANTIKIDFDPSTLTEMARQADIGAQQLNILGNATQNAEAAIKKMQTTYGTNIQSVTQLTMSITGLASGLGSLADMVSSGNMSFMGFLTVLTRVMPAIKGLSENTVVAGIATKLFGKFAKTTAVETTASGAAAEGAAVKITLFGHAIDTATAGITLIIKVIVAFVVALTALAVGIATWAKRQREARLETAETARTVSQTSKELSDAVGEQAAAYDEAAEKMEQYKDDNQKVAEAQAEMGEAIQSVIDTLSESDDAHDKAMAKELEHQLAIAELTGNYDSLTEAIHNLNQEMLESSITDAQISKDAAEKVFKDNMTQGVGNTWNYADKYSADIASWTKGTGETITKSNGEKKSVRDTITEGEYSHISSMGTILADKNDVNDWIKAYEEALALQRQLKEEGFTDTDYYKNLSDWLGKSADSYSQIAESQDYINEQALELLAIDPTAFVDRLNQDLAETDKISEDVAEKLTIPEGGFENLSEYEAFRSELQALADQGILTQDAIDGFLLTNSDTSKFEVVEDYIGKQMNDYKELQQEMSKPPEMSDEEWQQQLDTDFAAAEQKIKDFMNGLSEEDRNIMMGVELDADDLQNLDTSLQEALDKAKDLQIVGKVKTDIEDENWQKRMSAAEGLETGGTISAEDFKVFEDGYASFFQLMEDGTYQLIGDAQKLADMVESTHQQVLIDDSVESAQKAQDYAPGSGNYDKEMYDQLTEASRQAQQQLLVTADSLNELDALYQNLAQSMAEIGEGVDYSVYAEALQGLAAQYENTANEAKDYALALQQGTVEQIAAAESALKAATMIGEAADKYGLSADSLEIQAKELRKVAGEEEMTAEQAAVLAIRNQRMNKGVTELSKNWKDWSKELNKADKTSQDYADTAADLSDAVADLVNWYEDLSLSSDFITENMELMGKAAEGDIVAIGQLGAAVAQEAISNAQLDESLVNVTSNAGPLNKTMTDVNTAFEEYWQKMAAGTTAQEAFNSAQSGVAAGFAAIKANMEGLTDGSLSLDDVLGDPAKFVEQLNAYAAATGMTAQEMQQMLSSVGVSADVQTEYIEQDVEVPTYYEYSERDGDDTFTYVDSDGETKTSTRPRIRKMTIPGAPVTTKGYVGVAKIDMKGADGEGSGVPDIKFTGVQKPSTSAVNAGKSSGGGGSKKSSKAPTKKGDHKEAEKIKDRYTNIQASIDKTTRLIERLSDAEDDAWGYKKYKNLKLINQQLGIQGKKLQVLYKEAQDYLKVDQAALQKLLADSGLTMAEFNSDGFVANHENITRALNEMMAPLDAAIEAAEKAYDAAVDQGLTDEALEPYQEAIDEANKAMDKFDEKVKDKVIEALEQVDETAQKVHDTMNQLIENIRETMQNWVDKENIKLQLRIDINDQDIRTAEHLIELWGEIGTRMGWAADKYHESFNANYDTAEGLLKNATTMKDMIDGLMRGDNDAANWLLDKYGKEAYDEWINGNGGIPDVVMEQYEDAIDQLQDVRDTMQQTLRDMMQEWTKYLQLIMDDFDKLSEKLDRNQETLDMWNKVLDGMGMAETVDGAKAMSKLAKATYDTAKKTAHVYKEQALTAKKANDDATKALEDFKAAHGGASFDVANLTENELIQYQEFLDWVEQSEEAMNEAESAFKSAVQDMVDKMGEAMEAETTRLRAEFFDKINGAFTDWDTMQEVYDGLEEIEELTLDDLTKNYELDKLGTSITDYLNNATNPEALEFGSKLLDEINEKLANGEKITQEQLDGYKAQFEVMQAMDAYEEAKNAKNTMRLHRDASGNYSYVYSSDESSTEDKAQKLKDAIYEYEKLQQDAVDKYEDLWIKTYATIGQLEELKNTARYKNDAKYRAYVDEMLRQNYEKLDFYAQHIDLHYQQLYDFHEAALNKDSILYQNHVDHQLMTFKDSNLNIVMGTQDTFDKVTDFHEHFVEYMSGPGGFADQLEKTGDQIVSETWKDIEEVGEGLEFMEGDYRDLAALVSDKADEIISDNKDIARSATELKNTATQAIDSMTRNIVSNSNSMVTALNKVTKAIEEQIKALQALRRAQLAQMEKDDEENPDFKDKYSQPDYSYSAITNAAQGNDYSQDIELRKEKEKLEAYNGKVAPTAVVEALAKAVSEKSLSETEAFNVLKVYNHGLQPDKAALPTFDIHALMNRLDDLRISFDRRLFNEVRKEKWLKDYGSLDGFKEAYTGGLFTQPDVTRIAEKGPELVLNADDTEKILQAVKLIRGTVQTQLGTVDAKLFAATGRVAEITPYNPPKETDQALEQQVHIEANFPGVSVASEIEEALNNLVVSAAQYRSKYHK